MAKKHKRLIGDLIVLGMTIILLLSIFTGWGETAGVIKPKEVRQLRAGTGDTIFHISNDRSDTLFEIWDGTFWTFEGGDSGTWKGSYLKLGDAVDGWHGWFRLNRTGDTTIEYTDDSGVTYTALAGEGDMTAVNTTAPLAGGAASGDVTITLDPLDSTHVADGKIAEADLLISNSPTDEYALTWEADEGVGASGQMKWEAQAGGAGNAAITDSSITLLNATAWRSFYSNATATAIQELAFGTAGYFYRSGGPTGPPTWAALVDGDISNVLSISSAGAVDGGALTAQLVLADALDSTSENFVFDGAYHINSAEADSAYVTGNTVMDTADILRAEMQDSASTAFATKIVDTVRNITGVILGALTPVYTTGEQAGHATVDSAKASGAGTMACAGILPAAISNSSNGLIIHFGMLENINTSAWSVGDILYIASDGGLTNTRPTGTNLIQPMALVVKDHASQGEIEIYGSHDVRGLPNLPNTYLWVGNASAVPIGVAMSGDATINNTGVVDVTIETSDITNQTIIGDDVDSTSENFVFDGAFHINSNEADSAYATANTINDTADILRAEMADSASLAFTTKVCDTVKNVTGVALGALTPVYVTGENAGYITVDSAKSSSAATMQSMGVLPAAISNGQVGLVVNFGKITDINTSAWAIKDHLYVASDGGLTDTKPTGTNLIQSVAIVVRDHASEGTIEIMGAYRTNDVPNIPSTNFWVGNGSAVATPVAMSNDVTMANTGAVTLGADVVEEDHIADNGVNSEHYNDGSVDLVHLAAGVYAKDIVTTAPLTGATDNVLVGADADVTLAITVLKDIVTTSPLTGGTDDILPGADADITIAATIAKDIVATSPLTVNGGANLDNVIIGTDADITIAVGDAFVLNSTSDAIAGTLTADGLTLDANENITLGGQTLDHDGTNFAFSDDISVNAKRLTGNQHFRANFVNPNGLYDLDAEWCIVPVTEAALTVTRIDVTCHADPATELDFDLKWADAFIGLANAAVIDELNTTAGVTTITTGFDDATVVAGKCIYILFNADPDAAITQVIVDVTYDLD